MNDNQPGDTGTACITKENLLFAFPVGLRETPHIAALGDVTAEVLAERPAEISRVSLYPRIRELPEELLDILAYDFKVDWWDPNYTLEEKRRTLADSWHVHKLLGTKAAVETALRAIYPKSEVQEWFEYGGKPYHFKIFIDLTGEQWTTERPQNVLERVDFYKSLRSHLEAITTSTTIDPTTVYITPFLGKPMPSTKLPELEPVFPGTLVHLTPILGDGPQSTTLPPLEPVFPTAAIFGSASAVLQSITETALPTLKENDTTWMPELVEHISAVVHTVTETALPYLEQLPPGDMRAVQRISVRPLLPVTETRLPRLEDFDSEIIAVCKGKATAALQNISETKLPELEELP